MTNKEILQADILDILFEKRNKDYGAYALRRGYNERLLTALGGALVVILLFLFLARNSKKNVSVLPSDRYERRVMELKEIRLPADKPKEPEKPTEKIKPVVKTATKKYVSRIEIKPDPQVKEPVPDMASLAGNTISDKTREGVKDDGKPAENEKPATAGDGNSIAPVPEKIQSKFFINEKDPEFPGGPQALSQFLTRNLDTPSDLEEGEKKMVLIRFTVDKDGSVNTFTILTSGGNDFDNEVVRVCKKMPRWKPAIQNGINVPVNYMLPITFIGAEQ